MNFSFILFYPFSETMVAAEPVLLMALFLAIYLKALNGNSGALATQGGKWLCCCYFNEGFLWAKSDGFIALMWSVISFVGNGKLT